MTNAATLPFNPAEQVFNNATTANMGATQSYGTGDMQVGATTVTDPNPVFQINDTSFTLTNVDAGTESGGIGFMTFNITATVPEPSSAALLGLGGLALLLRRRK